MASDTKETENKRRWKVARQARRRKNREAKKSTKSWSELFDNPELKQAK